GILVLAPAIEARLNHPKPVLIRLFIESASAQLLTLPLIMYYFSQLSVVAPVTNLIVLPMVPLAMAASFIAGLAGMIIPAFAGWVSWPAVLILGFITRLIHGFSALPWAAVTLGLNNAGLTVSYILIALIIIVITRVVGRTRPSKAAPFSQLRLLQ